MTNNPESNSSTHSIFYSNCRDNWPLEICAFGNTCGLIQVAVSFVVFFPQIYRNFRHKSVEGLSVLWIITFFTSDIINFFFVFQDGLPLFSKIGAVYTPTINLILLIQIVIFTPFSWTKLLVIGLCLIVWTTIILVQCFLHVYQAMQWITVTLGCFSNYPQVFLNMKRQSTLGLSTVTVGLSVSILLVYFCSTYLLLMPEQNIVFCYFTSTCGYIVLLQVIYYWKREPRTGLEKPEIRAEQSIVNEFLTTWKKSSLACNFLKTFLGIYSCFFLILSVVAFIWRMQTWFTIFAPIGVIIVLLIFYFYYSTSFGQVVRTKFTAFLSTIFV